jgi:hypothetical protein
MIVISAPTNAKPGLGCYLFILFILTKYEIFATTKAVRLFFGSVQG